MVEFKPKWIALEITSRCNLHCVHCRSSSEKNHQLPQISHEKAINLLDDIASYTKPVVVLTGGEPLMHKNLFEIAQHGTESGLRMCIATNGTLVDDDICKKIQDSGIKMVSLSLDGSNEEIHDDFRQQPGAFRGTMRAMEYFRKYDIKFLVNSSFTKRNQHDIKKVYSLVKTTGATAWYMFLVVPTGRGKELLSELISPEDYDEILDWHYHAEQMEDDILMRPTCAPHYYRIFHHKSKESGTAHSRRDLTFSTGSNKGCVCAQSIAFISSSGDVQPCSYFNKSAGNVFEESFREIWDNSELFKSLRDFHSYRGKCGECEYLKVCGGCRARAEIYYDDYLGEEPYCNYIPLSRVKKES